MPNEPIEEDIISSISLKKIWKFFKKNISRFLIYMLISLIVVTSILSLVRVVAVNEQYKSKVTFFNKNIITGMSPWDTTLDISSSVKSSYVISAALKSVGYSDEEVDDMLENVIKNVSVNAVVDSVPEGATVEVYSYAFNIVLDKDSTLKLTDAKYISILDAITDEFVKEYKSQYKYATYFTDIANEDYSTNNYVQTYDILLTNVAQIKTLVGEMAKVAPDFRSTSSKLSFGNVLAEVESIETKLSAYQSLLVDKSASNANASGSTEAKYVEQKVATLTATADALSSQIASTQTLLENIKPNIIISGTGTIDSTMGLAEYYALVSDLIDLQSQYNEILNEKTVWQSLKTAYSGAIDNSSVTMEEVNSIINSIQQNIVNCVSNLNSTISDYNESDLLKNAIKKTAPAVKNTDRLLSNTVFIIIEILGIIIAVCCAIIVAKKKEKKV